MQTAIHIEKSIAIAFDADTISDPQKHHFEENFWREQNAITGTAQGRGNSWFVAAPFGKVVLRQYLRGGWAARISRDRYFYSGVESSRPFQEFSVLVALLNLDLPVPRPVAALCEHHGMLSRGALITQAIADVQTLAEFLPGTPANKDQGGKELGGNEQNGEQQSQDQQEVDTQAAGVDSSVWHNTGRCIRRFHSAGLWHADLNARNILLDKDQQVFLIDFDRARYTPGKLIDGDNNLARLKRSFEKISKQNHEEFPDKSWAKLMAGYND